MKSFVIFLMLFSPLYAFTGDPIFLRDLSPPGPNANIQLAVASNGQAIAVWTNFPNQIELQGKFYLVGNGWFHLDNAPFLEMINQDIPGFFAVVREDGTFALGSAPRVVIDNDGDATIVWVSPNNQIIAARYKPETLPSGRTRIALTNVTQLTATGTYNISPTIAVNQTGMVVVVWIQAASYQVLARSFNPVPGGGWGDTVTFMPIPPPGICPNITDNIPANPNGTYPASFGLSDIPRPVLECPIPNRNFPGVQGTMVWIDGPSGTVRSGNFEIPFSNP